MKTFRHFGFGLVAVLCVGLTALTSFAGGVQDDERAGYQGIPVRNGLNRGIVQHDESSVGRRYPRLPRRPNETDMGRADSVKDDQALNPNEQNRAGYSGIPQRSSYANGQNDESVDVHLVEHAGYGGIPARVSTDRQAAQPNNTFAAKRASASLVQPK